jgi:ubiquinone/menaquinone biosynthesis C-methylase UbiE
VPLPRSITSSPGRTRPARSPSHGGASQITPQEKQGWVTGVEPNARLRSVAANRAEANGVSNISFTDGLAGALPVPDSCIDLVWCERVLQHLSDPQGAINDIARVLRPGGRTVLLDSDHGTRIVSDLDLDVLTAFNRAALTRSPTPMRLDTFRRKSAGPDSN